MVDKEIKEEKVVDEALAKINQIKKAAGDFRENVASLVKDMNVTSNDWHFNVESHEKGVTIDVAVKLLITQKKVDSETHK
jgi:uncharacterized alkaline shock family protein YloU